jgi:hypothetical protein
LFGKLYIYDASSPEDRDQARVRFGDGDVRALAVASRAELTTELDRLVAEKAYFSRVLVQTHGAPGRIDFNGLSIYDTTLKTHFAGRGYERLFPLYTRIYFDGCNVAEGSSGDGFLQTVGEIFLRRGGGEVFGWTSLGYGITHRIPIIGGHTVHVTGHVKKMHFRLGGVRIPAPKGNVVSNLVRPLWL